MTISAGDRLPAAKLIHLGPDGPQPVSLPERGAGRSLVVFAVPGAFTPTCHSAHMPSFVRNMDALAAKGVDEVICLAVNDPFVMQAWGEATGATAAGITLLSDADGSFARAMGLTFDVAAIGLHARSRRYALHAVDGVIRVLHIEEARGTCEMSGGEAMLAAL